VNSKQRKPEKVKKGKTHNPRGRPKGSKNKSNAELNAILDKCVNFEKLIRAMATAAYNGNEKAGKILLDHRFGKARERITLEGETTNYSITFGNAEKEND
jgi:hypothetical protein